MIILLPDGKQIGGDMIVRAVLRNDLSPIPVTFEADIRTDDAMDKHLAEGEILTIGGTDVVRIIKSERITNPLVQGDKLMSARRITAVLDSVHPVSFVRRTAIIKENATLAGIYRAAGASLRAVEADFPVPRFTCMVGETPSYHIARTVQEEGGVIRWKAGKLRFSRLPDLFRQTPIIELRDSLSEDVDSGFLERHTVPWFFSLDNAGGFVFGNRDKPRSVAFAPNTNVQRLRNMSRYLVRRKIQRMEFAGAISAGDIIGYAGAAPLCVITAAHVWESGTDGSGMNMYSRFWLGSMEQ